ncbi:aspartate 4-decarboxylase [Clostridium sp. AL.422]|nr:MULTISPECIES: aspartate 4-decarboxylase [unclassified Clostridium]MDV4152551.1 aspartate 4-decarboxylase [Clostridium sp. AL.422]
MLNKDYLKKLYGRISPFEFKDKLISLANLNKEKFNGTVLDAGRGNPNWTSSTPRQAFFTLGQFAVLECQRTLCAENLAGMIKKDGIYNRFIDYYNENSNLAGIKLLRDIIDYCINEFNFNKDDFLFEICDGIIGDNYPFPDRMLLHIEKIVNRYLLKELCGTNEYNDSFDVFAVEGGTAAMCYIFNSLAVNNLLRKGDTIALMTPIFTPYLEIPHLPEYDFNVIRIHANELDENNKPTFQYPMEELEKLKNNNIKALFIVNPNNPASIALNEKTINNLINVVTNYNPNLMIITDDVYCTFIKDFKSIISYLPYNTIGVYSLSKYFGVTGWRLGSILLNKNNIFNDLIKNLSDEEKENLNTRYKHMSLNPEEVPFIDRLVADSRQVALNHTAGLSTPQQVQMALFCGSALVDIANNYKKLTMEICQRRKSILFEGLQLELTENPMDASYYTEINILDWARIKYNEEFSNYISENYTPFDILYDLARNYSVVLLNGDGFASSEWSFRVSLANLNDNCYYIIGKVLRKVLNELLLEWQKLSWTNSNLMEKAQ